MINIGFIIILIIVGIIVGIICGALWIMIKTMLIEKKAQKDYKNGKNTLEIKEFPKEKIKQRSKKNFPIPISDEEVMAKGDELEVKKPEIETKKNIFRRIFKKNAKE